MDLLSTCLARIEENGDTPFLIDSFGGVTLTYAESQRLASLLGVELRRQGVARGGRVGLLLKNSVEFALLYFACLYIGAVAVPVNPTLSAREVEFIVGHAGLDLLVASPATRPLVDPQQLESAGIPLWLIQPGNEPRGESVPLFETLPAEVPADFVAAEGITDDELFSINFTSGTTGLPKGVVHRVGGLLRSAAAFNQELGIDAESRFLHVMPMAYMAGFLNTLLCPWVAGGSVVITSAFDPLSMLRFWGPVTRYAVNTLWLSPTMLAGLVGSSRNNTGPDYCRAHMRTVCAGTAPLPPTVQRAFEEKFGVAVDESYGLSEILFIASNAAGGVRRSGTVGRLLEGVEVRLVGKDGGDVTPEEGEIEVRTPFIMAGYLDYETLQPAEIAPDAWFPTGDIGRLEADGALQITGRKKDLIIRGGVNVSPRQVEEVLLEHPAVAQAAVIGLPHDLYGEEVTAVLVLQPGQVLDELKRELQQLCRERLSSSAVPTCWVEVPELPVSSTGKVQKNVLRDTLGGAR
ncbi:MAG: putative o-succinylbenzoate--CoA ligase [Armatimonadetes bacterium]|jgi:long-chain acyl-CoA synthetase|nr:putative o-succinylbenzoate--CoA ligase [Armatimonadota bacterium]